MTFLTGGLNFACNATFLILLILAKQRGASPALIGVMFVNHGDRVVCWGRWWLASRSVATRG